MTTPKQKRFYETLNRRPWGRKAPPQDSVAVPVGTMSAPIPQAVENLTATEVHSRYATWPGTSPYAIQSGNNSMDNLSPIDDIPNVGEDQDLKKGPKAPPAKAKKYFPSFSINGTQCCGQHTLSGFQYSREPDCEALIIGVHQAYKSQGELLVRIQGINRQAEIAHFQGPDKNKRFIPPEAYPQCATKIAGMIVFTWNSVAYDPAAKKLSEFISKNGLGRCAFSGKAVNPNSLREIEAMTWLIDQKGYANFINKYLQDYI